MMPNPRYIAFDTETGGLDPKKHSLLTAYFVALDNKLNIVDELELAVKDSENGYIVTASALAVNKINLIKHDEVAIEKKEAANRLKFFIERMTEMNGGNKLIPIAHNIEFDMNFINNQLLSNFTKLISHRKMCTSVITRFLSLSEEIPKNVGGSLSKIAKRMGIKFNKDGPHNAKSDVEVTVKLLKAYLGW